MRMTLFARTALFAGVALLSLPVVAEKALPDTATMGPKPTLLEPDSSLIPIVNIAPEKGWSPDATPVAAAGLSVSAYATGLVHPRTLHVLPNGDVLVAETNAPAKHDEQKSIKGWVMKKTQKAAGAGVVSLIALHFYGTLMPTASPKQKQFSLKSYIHHLGWRLSAMTFISPIPMQLSASLIKLVIPKFHRPA